MPFFKTINAPLVYGIQVASASASLVASLVMAIAIIRSDGGLKRSPYRRIIFGLSLSDILQSLVLVTGPFATPSDNPIGVWGVGNQSSCRLNGFFFTWSLGSTPMYMLGLCIYTVLKVRRNMTDKAFSKHIEKKMHYLIALLGFLPSFAALLTNAINCTVLGGFCAISAYPTGCRLDPDTYGECDVDNAKYVVMIGLVSHLIIPTTCLLGIIGCMSIVCLHMVRMKRIYGQINNNASSKTEVDGKEVKTNSISISTTCSLNPLRKKQSDAHPFARNEIEDNDMDTEDQKDNVINETSNTSQGEDMKRTPSNSLVIAGNGNVLGPWTTVRVYRKEIVIQACWFVLSFFVIFLFWWIMNLTLLAKTVPPHFVIYTMSFLYPLGGLFNVLVYTRPKVVNFRIKYAEYNHSWIRAFWLVLKNGGEMPSKSRNPQDAVVLGDANADLPPITSIPFKFPPLSSEFRSEAGVCSQVRSDLLEFEDLW